MKIVDVLSVIENFAAPELQEGYDNAGLITGNRNWDCTGIICCLDVTEGILKEAMDKGSNLVIAHHPIVFKGLKRLTGSNYVEKIIIESIKNDIAIYAVHTNLDNVIMGVNGMMANKLKLVNISILEPKRKVLRRLITFAPTDNAEMVRQAVFKAGAGVIGKYSDCSFNTNGMGTFKAGEGANPFVGEIGKLHEEKETKIEIVFPFYMEEQVVKALIENHPYEEVAYDIFTMDNVHLGIGAGLTGDLPNPMSEVDFLHLVKSTFRAEGLRHTALCNKTVKRVALCGGAGSFLIPAALKAGVNVFITSDVKYHEFFDAQGKLVIADIGHYESEQFTIDLIHDLLAEKFPTFAILKTGINTNPVKYLF